MNALIEIEDLHYRPDSLPEDTPDILRGISLHICEGEFVAIIGENGSGKTTFIKHLNALITPSNGTVTVGGLDTRILENHRKIRSIVGMVFQNPADQIVASTVAEDVAFGLENLNLPTSEIQHRVEEQLMASGLTGEKERPPHLLSGGQVQKLALAGVLARRPRILLFDEPTSMLDPVTRKAFLQRICRLYSDGRTILYATHHMDEVVIASRVLVFKEGKVVLDGKPADLFTQSDKLYEAGLEIPETMWFGQQLQILGWDLPGNLLDPDELAGALPAYPGGGASQPSVPEDQSGEIIIQLENVHYTYLADSPLARPALQGVSLTADRGQVHGVAGTNGSGKSTLLQHINGILRPEKGQVRVLSMRVSDPETPLREIVQRVGLVFQNPETQFFEVFVGDEIAYGPKQFNLPDVRQRVQEAMALVSLDFLAFKDRRLETLSGGEKRKVALASTLILDPDILLFDEPTAGMDPQARDDLLELFEDLKAQGKTLLIASHRLEELARAAAILSLMQDGKILQTGPVFQELADVETLSGAGLAPPLAVRLSQVLIDQGWPLAGLDTSTPSRLMDALKELSA